MKSKINNNLIEKEGQRAYYQLTITCTKCGKEYASGNVFKAEYCEECAEIVKRERTRERVRQYRQRKKEDPGTTL